MIAAGRWLIKTDHGGTTNKRSTIVELIFCKYWQSFLCFTKSISRSLLNEVGILENLAKQENFVSNGLGNKIGIFSNLAFLPSARASLRARIRLRIAVSRIGAGLPARSRKFPRLFPAPSPRPLSRRLLLGRDFFPWLRPSSSSRSVPSPRTPPP